MILRLHDDINWKFITREQRTQTDKDHEADWKEIWTSWFVICTCCETCLLVRSGLSASRFGEEEGLHTNVSVLEDKCSEAASWCCVWERLNVLELLELNNYPYLALSFWMFTHCSLSSELISSQISSSGFRFHGWDELQNVFIWFCVGILNPVYAAMLAVDPRRMKHLWPVHWPKQLDEQCYYL